MRCIIVDDSEYKRNQLKEYIRNINDEAEIIEFEDSNGILRYLHPYFYNEKDRKELINTILFLDWIFPTRKGERPEIGEGGIVLYYLHAKELHIPTVIISSEIVNKDEIEDEYREFLLPQIKFDSSVYLKPDISDRINKAMEMYKNENN